jgi:hypothetical protein
MDDAMKSRLLLITFLTKVSFNDMVIKACAMALKIQKLTPMEGRSNYNQPSC